MTFSARAPGFSDSSFSDSGLSDSGLSSAPLPPVTRLLAQRLCPFPELEDFEADHGPRSGHIVSAAYAAAQIESEPPLVTTSPEVVEWLSRWNFDGEEVVHENRHLYAVCHRVGNLVIGYSVKSSLEKRSVEDAGTDISGGLFDTITQATKFLDEMLAMDERWIK